MLKIGYLFIIIFIIITLILNISCSTNPTDTEDKINKAPIASFEFYPDSGTIFTYFRFDAMGSYDDNDSLSVLEIRWDWENDQIWDVDYTQTKEIFHNYSTPGIYTVKMEIKDPQGLSDTNTVQVQVSEVQTGTVTDIDGNIYKTVKIGNQWWMAENLKVKHYRNGDAISNITVDTLWSHLTSGAYCSYNNDENNAVTYGYLYNWHVVNDSRGIAPAGWHVPSDLEWKQLEMDIGMRQVQADSSGWRGKNFGNMLKLAGTNFWYDNYTYANNSTGFSALPSGFRNGDTGIFYDLNGSVFFWSTTESYGSAWYRHLQNYNSGIRRYGKNKWDGFSIRCVKD